MIFNGRHVLLITFSVFLASCTGKDANDSPKESPFGYSPNMRALSPNSANLCKFPLGYSNIYPEAFEGSNFEVANDLSNVIQSYLTKSDLRFIDNQEARDKYVSKLSAPDLLEKAFVIGFDFDTVDMSAIRNKSHALREKLATDEYSPSVQSYDGLSEKMKKTDGFGSAFLFSSGDRILPSYEPGGIVIKFSNNTLDVRYLLSHTSVQNVFGSVDAVEFSFGVMLYDKVPSPYHWVGQNQMVGSMVKDDPDQICYACVSPIRAYSEVGSLFYDGLYGVYDYNQPQGSTTTLEQSTHTLEMLPSFQIHKIENSLGTKMKVNGKVLFKGAPLGNLKVIVKMADVHQVVETTDAGDYEAVFNVRPEGNPIWNFAVAVPYYGSVPTSIEDARCKEDDTRNPRNDDVPAQSACDPSQMPGVEAGYDANAAYIQNILDQNEIERTQYEEARNAYVANPICQTAMTQATNTSEYYELLYGMFNGDVQATYNYFCEQAMQNAGLGPMPRPTDFGVVDVRACQAHLASMFSRVTCDPNQMPGLYAGRDANLLYLQEMMSQGGDVTACTEWYLNAFYPSDCSIEQGCVNRRLAYIVEHPGTFQECNNLLTPMIGTWGSHAEPLASSTLDLFVSFFPNCSGYAEAMKCDDCIAFDLPENHPGGDGSGNDPIPTDPSESIPTNWNFLLWLLSLNWDNDNNTPTNEPGNDPPVQQIACPYGGAFMPIGDNKCINGEYRVCTYIGGGPMWFPAYTPHPHCCLDSDPSDCK